MQPQPHIKLLRGATENRSTLSNGMRGSVCPEFSFTTVTTQQDTCFVQLENFTGFELSQSEFDELNQAACDLVDSLPQQYQDSFKVYDFGFYVNNKFMIGGVDSILSEVVSNVKDRSKYYMLFIRAPNANMLLRINLPTADIFSCLDLEKIEFLKSSIDLSLKGVEDGYSNLKNVYLRSIGKLNEEVFQLKECCVVNLKKQTTTCDACPDDVQAFRYHLERNGFIGRDIEIESVSHGSSINESVESLADINVIINGEEVDLNLDVANYINPISEKVEGVEARIGHYDPSETSCTDILGWVTDINLNTLKEDENTSQKESEIISEYLMRMDVITTEDEFGNVEVHLRSKEDLGELAECDVGTIYIINVDGPNINMNQVRHYVDTFWKVLNVDTINNLRPYVLDLNYLSISQLRDLDAISVIGNDECKVYEYVKDNYRNYDSFNFLSDILSWANTDNELHLEVADSGEEYSEEIPYLSVVSTSRITNKIVNDFACRNKEEAISFVIFHATGHNAGIVHCGPESCIKGFMSKGSCIMKYIKNNGNYRCISGGNEFSMKYHYDNLYQVIINETDPEDYSRIKNRFIK